MKIEWTDSSRSKKDRLMDYAMNFIVILLMLSILMYMESCPCAFSSYDCCQCIRPNLSKYNGTFNIKLTFYANLSLNSSDMQDIVFSNVSASENNP